MLVDNVELRHRRVGYAIGADCSAGNQLLVKALMHAAITY
jgi:hypothetical protein